MTVFEHWHPYAPYIPNGTEKLIVGTLPPPRFTTGVLLPGDVNFCYGSRDGQLWQILEKIFDVSLVVQEMEAAIQQRKSLLEDNKIGICDMIERAYRDKIDASDIGIRDAELRPIISLLEEHTHINRILFMGGNSKNGPEYFFRKRLKSFPNIRLELVNNDVPRIHQFELNDRIIQTVSLTAPSGSANRAVGSMALYKKMKEADPNFNTIDFRVMQYAPFFKDI